LAIDGFVDKRSSLAYIANDTKGYPMTTRNVVLTDAQSSLVDQLVETGRYQNASEALRAGLRLLEREENEIRALRNQITEGLAQAGAGDLAGGSGEEAVRRAFATARGDA
jgi:antitoxin ParD1/3/4